MPARTRSRFARLPNDLARIELMIVVVSAFVGLVVGAAVLFGEDLIHTPSDDAETGGQSSDFVVVTEQPKEAAVDVDPDDPEGDLGDLTKAELTGLRWSHNRYRAHTSVGADVTIVEDAGLLRSAELLDGQFDGDEIALRAEAVGSNLGTWQADSVLAELKLLPEYDEAALERAIAYLSARSQPPSDYARDTYVVFEVPNTLSVTYIVRMRIGSVVNDDLPHRRNTAIYAYVDSPDRNEPIRVRRPDVELACDTLSGQ